MFKPFKPPLPKRPQQATVDLTIVPDSDTEIVPDSDEEIQARPFKKRRLLVHEVQGPQPEKAPTASIAARAPRKPLLVVKDPINLQVDNASSATEGPEGYYMVLWYVPRDELANLQIASELVTNIPNLGVNSQRKNIRHGMEMESYQSGEDMPVCRIYQEEKWAGLCLTTRCCQVAV